MATKAELLKFAEEYVIEVDESANKPVVEQAIVDAGFTLDQVDDFFKEPEEEVKEDAGEQEEPVSNEEVLVKMTRSNYSYHTAGYKFSREHPFAVVKKADVDHLVKTLGGFALATDSEVKEYYG